MSEATAAAAARRYFPVSWNELHRDAKALAWRLAERGPWKGIVAITRGGLVPAHIIARELDIRLIDTVCVSSYDDEIQRETALLKRPEGDGEDDPPPRERLVVAVEEPGQGGDADIGGLLHGPGEPVNLRLLQIDQQLLGAAERAARRRLLFLNSPRENG